MLLLMLLLLVLLVFVAYDAAAAAAQQLTADFKMHRRLRVRGASAVRPRIRLLFLKVWPSKSQRDPQSTHNVAPWNLIILLVSTLSCSHCT